MGFKAKLVTGGPGGHKVITAMRDLTHKQVYVGVPEKTSGRRSRKGEAITNAQLTFLHTHGVRESSMRRIVQAKMNRGLTFEAATAMYLHTHGSPLYQIPPRPIIEPAIEAADNKEAIAKELKQAAEAALAGKPGGTRTHLRMAGMEAQNRTRAWFTDPRNGWAPNAPSTIRRKKSDRPLIDTQQLRKSITYVVVE